MQMLILCLVNSFYFIPFSPLYDCIHVYQCVEYNAMHENFSCGEKLLCCVKNIANTLASYVLILLRKKCQRKVDIRICVVEWCCLIGNFMLMYVSFHFVYGSSLFSMRFTLQLLQYFCLAHIPFFSFCINLHYFIISFYFNSDCLFLLKEQWTFATCAQLWKNISGITWNWELQ